MLNKGYNLLNRNQLKDRFRAGQMPTQDDFHSLIDSVVNCVEEGFDVDFENGLEIRQKKDSGHLASFFANLTEHMPQWMLGLRKNIEKGECSLNLKTPDMKPEQTAVTVVGSTADKPGKESTIRVGVGTSTPKCELDVDGIIASKGRIGFENDKFEVVADGEWHDVTEVLTGCQCFEVVAGVGGKEGDGKFALAHAIAVNAFNSNPSVNITQSFSGGRGAKIEIRWKKCEKKYEFTLQIRVRHKYDDAGKIKVRYQLTKLWHDTQMIGSLEK